MLKSRTCKIKDYFYFILVIFLIGCATYSSRPIVWEGQEIARPYDILGPVSVSEEVAESTGDTIQGLAGYIAKDGRISNDIPEDIKQALLMKRMKYKDMIFDKLSLKANKYDADAVIEAEYTYVPALATFSNKAMVSAEGMMVKFKK